MASYEHLPFCTKNIKYPEMMTRESMGGMTGEIWERSKTSLPCSFPFV